MTATGVRGYGPRLILPRIFLSITIAVEDAGIRIEPV